MKDEKQSWYSVKQVFHEPGYHFEERVIVVNASDFDIAENKGREEALRYVSTLGGLRFIAIIDVFHMFDESLADNTEVYSRITETKLTPEEYIGLRYEQWDGQVIYMNKE